MNPIPRKNPEGYPDPTAYEALTTIQRAERAYLPLVYIASPYAGDTAHNVQQAQGYCAFAVTRGCIPLAPHLLYPQFMNDSDPTQRREGLRFALILLSKCDELWVFGTRISDGMRREITKAHHRHMPIRFFTDTHEEVLHHA